MSALGLEAAVEEGLFGHVKAYSDSLSPPMPVAWPNVHFEPVVDVPYLRVDILTSSPTRLTVAHDDTNIYAGLLQVTAVYPLGVGSILPSETVAAVLDHFRPGTTINHQSGRQIKVGRADGGVGLPYRGVPSRDGNWWNAPAIIPWYALVARGVSP